MENLKNKYYIRLNKDNRIIKTFSSVFEKAKERDILIGEGIGSQVRFTKDKLHTDLSHLIGVENGLDLINEMGIYQYKYENDLVTKISNEELQSDIEKLPKPKPSKVEKLEEDNKNLRAEIENLKKDNIDTMLAITEMYEMML